MKSHAKDYTQGSIVGSLFALAIPIVFANILQTAYQLIDTFWVGRLGENAVAAVSMSFPLIFLLISLAGGLTMAGTILVAQYRGRKDQKQVNFISAQTLCMMLITSVISSVLGYLLARPLMVLMGAGPDIIDDAVSYLHVTFLGLVFMFGFFVYQSLMRGIGDVKTPAMIVLGTVILNLIFDPLFIFGWGPIPAYGVTGAAVATIATQGIATVIGMILLLGGKHGVQIRLHDVRPDVATLKRMFLLGLPASVSQSVRAFGMLVMTFLVASFGTITIASYGIGIRILSFIIIPAIGFAMATSTLVGQNIGAGKMQRATQITRVAGLLSFVVLTVGGILLFFFARPITQAFVPDSPELIASGSLFIRIMALSFGCIGVQQTLNGAFQGAGNTMASMIFSVVSIFLLQFPLAYILSKHTSLGAEGIYWAFPLTNVVMAVVTVIWYSTGAWNKKQLIQDSELVQKVVEETMVEEGIS